MKTLTDKRVEDLPPVRRSDAEGAMLWIDDPTGKIVDCSSLAKSLREVEEVALKVPVTSRRSLNERVPYSWILSVLDRS